MNMDYWADGAGRTAANHSKSTQHAKLVLYVMMMCMRFSYIIINNSRGMRRRAEITNEQTTSAEEEAREKGTTPYGGAYRKKRSS